MTISILQSPGIFLSTMKILHALVGYLTVTLPFSPFAFASPLAGIHYDGYVNTTQNLFAIDSALMNHAIGNLVEACISQSPSGYVDATENHNDSPAALMKRVPGQIIEARFGPAIVPPVLTVIAIVAAITLSIIWIESDDPVRGNNVLEHSD